MAHTRVSPLWAVPQGPCVGSLAASTKVFFEVEPFNMSVQHVPGAQAPGRGTGSGEESTAPTSVSEQRSFPSPSSVTVGRVLRGRRSPQDQSKLTPRSVQCMLPEGPALPSARGTCPLPALLAVCVGQGNARGPYRGQCPCSLQHYARLPSPFSR